MNFKGLLNHKTVLLLLFVVIVNLVVGFLVLRLDLFVHGDLYAYGLVFSLGWATPYWHSTTILWTFLGVATALAAAAIVPHYQHSRKISRFSTWTGFFLPILALASQAMSIFYLNQKNSIVWSTLRDYGAKYESDWATAYNLFSVSALVLMAVALLPLIIPAIRAVGYEIQITRD